MPNWTPITPIGTYNSNAVNPTIAVIRAQMDTSVFHLAWQTSNTSINYCTLRPYLLYPYPAPETWEIAISDIETPSTGSTHGPITTILK